MLESLIAVFAPHECIGCGDEGALLCVACESALGRVAGRCYRCKTLSTNGRTCPTCRRVSKIRSVQAVTDYQNVLAKELVARLKFGSARAAARDVARVMAQTVGSIPENAVIVHVPTATGRRRQRGYDQAALIARELAYHMTVPYSACLLRLGQQRQVGASRQQRLQQLQGQFVIARPARIRGRTVILVDDVVTTGASLEVAAEALRAAGAKRVRAVVFARA